jgi:hypothetical protein
VIQRETVGLVMRRGSDRGTMRGEASGGR